MKKKQLKEIKNKTAQDLEKLVMETKTQLIKLKLEVLSGKNKNKRLGKSLRKEIAQMKTIISMSRHSREGGNPERIPEMNSGQALKQVQDDR